jgi:hypothetical protein
MPPITPPPPVTPPDTTSPPAPPPQPPAQLSIFDASLLSSEQKVGLFWTMSAKVSNPYFLIQRSTDSVTFSVIDTVSAAQVMANNNTYSAVDMTPCAGANYYRIAQAGPQGDTTYPEVRKVMIPKGLAADVRVMPNPVNGVLHLIVSDQSKGDVFVRLLDTQGNLLFSWIFKKQGQQMIQDIDVGMLEPGNYFIQVLDQHTHAAKPIIKL